MTALATLPPALPAACAPPPTREESEALCRTYAWLVNFHVGRYARRAVGMEPDDLRQEATLALLHARRIHPPGSGSFTGFAGTVIRRRLAHVVRHWYGRNRAAHTEALANAAGRAPDPAAVAELHDLSARLTARLAALDARDREALHLHYGEGLTMTEIAKRQGCSREWVRKRLDKALRLAREHFGN